MINRLIRNFLNGQHIIREIRHVQTVHVAFLHQCAKNVCPAAVLSWGVRMASSSNRPSNRSKLSGEYSNNGGSQLLDDYHNNRAANLQLADLGKDAVAFALDPQGSRFIEQKLGRASPTVKARLVDALRGHVVTLSLHMNGSHVIQTALKSVDKTSQMEIINEISAHVTSLSLHKYGCWVIQCVLELCTEQQKRPVLEQLHGNVLSLVTDQFGCHVIERVLEHGLPEDRERIVRSLQGNLFTLVTDPYGNFVIQQAIEHGLPEDRERIVHILKDDIMKYAQDKFASNVILKCLICGTADQKKALIDNVCGGGLKTLQNARQLMADEFGHYVIEKFFEYGTDDQKAQLVDALRGHVLTFALQMYGSHVIEKALKSVDKTLQMEIIEELTPRACVIRCIKDQYGAYVMNTIIELIEPQRLQFVVDAIMYNSSDSVASLCLHEYGSLVIQRVLKHCTEQQKHPLLEQLLENVLTLATDLYGNYVIQHAIEYGLPEDRARIVHSLQGDILKNAHHKGICNVIEKCFVFGTTEQRNALIDQVCTDDGTGKPPLLQIMKHPFANDVVLKMHDLTDSAHRDKMMFAIKEHIPALIRLKARQLKQQSLTTVKAQQKGGAVADKKKKLNNGLLDD
uniref:PUM-HD domain-containing protein n=1 Tax=Globodera rostochiensis TaxID=31243 RepID=A0A914HRL9_GLORO